MKGTEFNTEQKNQNLSPQECEFLLALQQKLNDKEYAFLMRRAQHSEETMAKSAKEVGISECYARKIAQRLRCKIDVILGIRKR